MSSLSNDGAGAPRIGVFVCDCGDKIASILDVEKLVKSAGELPGVVYAGSTPYWCSADGQERLQAVVRAEGLERVVVAGCSPRTHRRLFQGAVARAGLNPELLGLINIREGCAWPHQGEHRAATARARDQIGMEVGHMAALTLRPQVQTRITPAALVIGGGVAGMTAALELAGAGIPVTLVERAGELGGWAAAQASDGHEEARLLAAELARAVRSNPHVTLALDSRVTQVDGSVGVYQVIIAHHESGSTSHGPFGAMIVATGAPGAETGELARLLRLTQDAESFLPELRVRLRPDNYIERGIYICGEAHYPCDLNETQFQAYSAASRALHHLRRGRVTTHGPVVQVESEKCNGCGDCFRVCPFAAVTMAERPSGLSLAVIDPLLCTGCGNCVSICPVGAVTVAGWTDAQLEAQMQVALAGALNPGAEPRVLIFACEWSGYAAAELAGAQKLTYPPNVRMIRLDCSGRLQPGLILKAFEMGAAGVLILACAPKLCHYERGNERAAAAYEQVEALTGLLGLPSTQLKLAWTPPDDGRAFAGLVTEFVRGLEETIEATA